MFAELTQAEIVNGAGLAVELAGAAAGLVGGLAALGVAAHAASARYATTAAR